MGCEIRVSEPLLKVGGQAPCSSVQQPGPTPPSSPPASRAPPPRPQLRPLRDLKMVLLHEMIHADNFLSGS
jgi:hypothetical protein